MAKSDFSTIYNTSVTPGEKPLGFALQTHEKRSSYVIEASENPQDLEPGNIISLEFNGITFTYDASDAISVHDGVTVIVTSDGKRFKADATSGVEGKYRVIKDKDLTVPPGSPANGDQYYVAAGATGDWAAKDGLIAVFGARGWVFIALAVYDLLFVVDETGFYHKASGGSLVSGLPGFVVSSGSIDIPELKRGLGLAVENQTTDTPPPTPNADDAYIIGPIPTGVWAGNPRKLAIYNGSSWDIYTPENGWTVFDKAISQAIIYNPTNLWVASLSGIIGTGLNSIDSYENLNGVTGTAYSFSNTVAPTTLKIRVQDDDIAVTYTAKSTSSKLRITYNATVRFTTLGGGGNIMPAIHRDAETAALVWTISHQDVVAGDVMQLSVSFVIDVVDLLPHSYKPFIYQNSTNVVAWADHRSMVVEEIAQ